MIRLRRITGRGADAAIFFLDQFATRGGFVGRVAPEFLAYALVHALRKSFGETIRQCLDHDRRIIVVRVLEAIGDHVLADAGGDDEGADVVLHA